MIPSTVVVTVIAPMLYLLVYTFFFCFVLCNALQISRIFLFTVVYCTASPLEEKYLSPHNAYKDVSDHVSRGSCDRISKHFDHHSLCNVKTCDSRLSTNRP